jgi:heat-inducible transcriptional repressor
MSDLEAMGLLDQPHPSAGRIPTESGYRVYVDSMMQGRPIAPSDEEIIQRALEQRQDPADLFAHASRVLSRISHQIGVVVTPHVAQLRLRHIEFVRLAPRRIVAVIVAHTGVIHNKVFETEEDHAQERLDQAGRYLTETFAGHTLPEIRERIVGLMAEEKALYDRILHDALALGRLSTESAVGDEAAQDSRVFLDGTANLVGAPEFADAERLRGIFRTFEEKHHLVSILNRCIAENHHGVRVFIGSETQVPDLGHCTVITSAYGPEGSPRGALGVIGPTRMEYAKAVALVEYVSRFFGNVLEPYGT